MSQIMKAFTGVFITLFLLVTATGILGMFFQTTQAQNLHSLIVNELENSDCARTVLEDAFDSATEYGYSLKVELIRENQTNVVCESREDIPASTANVHMARVSLGFPIEMTFFGVMQQETLIGYAR